MVHISEETIAEVTAWADYDREQARVAHIPSDLMEAARDVWRRMGFINDRLDQVPFIAIALAAERQRCASHTASLKMQSCTCPTLRTDGNHNPCCMTDRVMAAWEAIRSGKAAL